MSITRDDIINKVFSRAVLGYDDSEVDSFLDEIIVDIENLNERLLEAHQESEKLKIAVNRISEESARMMASRQEINTLRDDNRKLLVEVEKLSGDLELPGSGMRVIDGAEINAESIVLDAKLRAEDLFKAAEKQAQDMVQNAEKESSGILLSAKESANKIAQNVQEREKQIMDRAQQRARAILESSQQRAEVLLKSAGYKSETKISSTEDILRKATRDSSFEGVSSPIARIEALEAKVSEEKTRSNLNENTNDEWPGWLEK